MHLKVIQRIVGLLLLVFSVSMLPPALVGWFYSDPGVAPFLEGFLLLAGVGLFLWLPVRKIRRDLRLRDGFIVVVLFWVGLGLAGAVPLVLSEVPEISLTDAVFESISGLTTTGATVITGLDELPKSILIYRQQLQWLGGMGIIVLAVAILPILGVGGMQLYRAEAPGPVKDAKLTPRITETSKALWYIYLILTIVCALSYWLAGMEMFDAVSHAFSTVAIGGFSTHDASFGYFDSALIESVAIVFMLLSGMNFALHFYFWRSMSIKSYINDQEAQVYFTTIVLASVLVVSMLFFNGVESSLSDAVRSGIFQTVSIATTTGFITTNFTFWPAFIPVLLLLLSFIGGCAGSTGGGIKVVRVMLLFKQGMRETMRLIHPNAMLLVKVHGKPTSEKILEAVWGFFSAYILVFVIFMLLMMFTGMDQITAFSAVAASLNNLGPGLGEVAENYASITDGQKWALSMAMLFGRLEIFTLLVVLTPAFWRQ